ncbi:DNA mismatch repair endonuclease MutL [Culicoidibacter larvae]|uniref:DNA mismatch repair protein MutL n=1 Tax=Culicoidibacter larvae TaxID=2579976 RepID=A0A5R8QD07_9FIRM|nr:DNA mismatch repair endonuclease MutL [Culicoidibacter larvae]TLG74170.1 DNA mismatch repair endonuclease MutL [Culicoidibacter larvae]
MNNKIILMSQQLSNKIAAGEVVERPASVVKELVENAIDANSTEIEVILLDSGIRSITVIDNGDGMEREDAVMAFERHATSKIHDEYELFHIQTLGFRGEALPSIASVSQVTMETSTGDVGTKVVIHGGNEKEVIATSARKGTKFVVENLFYNTPARLKYLKSVHTELAHIVDFINRMALAHPEIRFRLLNNQKEIIKTFGSNDFKQALAVVYGLDTAKKMMHIEAEDYDFKIDGYISIPQVQKNTRNAITLIVNGRSIKNYSLIRAITDGYHTMMPKNCFPIALLSITMDPLLVDVNVHPSKLEVRFSKEQQLKELITETIRKVLLQKQFITQIERQKMPKDTSAQQKISFSATEKAPVVEQREFKYPNAAETRSDATTPKREQVAQFIEAIKPDKEATMTLSEGEPEWLVDKTDVNQGMDPVFDLPGRETDAATLPAVELPEALPEAEDLAEKTYVREEANAAKIPDLEVIGQFRGTYIMAQNEDGLFIIDQHAAQERIKYEMYFAQLGQPITAWQDLLIPHTIELPYNEFIVIDAHLDLLAGIGLVLEAFGHQSYIIRTMPVWMTGLREDEYIQAIIDQIVEKQDISVADLREAAAIMMSCRYSIKANHNLTITEMEDLINELRKCESPYTCPHGRPVIISYSVYDVEKWFKRV